MDTQRTYNLDAAGNWVSDGAGTPAVSFTHDCGAHDTEDRTTNSWNQVASLSNSGVPITPIQYDTKGNLTAYGNLSFEYDAFNRMISASGTGPDGQPVSASYAYDALGRRIQKLVNDVETNFFYDGQQVVEEQDDNGTALRQYVWGHYVDDLVQQREYEKPPFGGPHGDLYPLNDLLYRSWALTHDRECGSGSSSGGPGGGGGGGGTSSSSGPTTPFVEVYDTDAYGRTRVYNAPGPDGQWFTDDDTRTFTPLCRYIYTGREYDPETGLGQVQIRL